MKKIKPYNPKISKANLKKAQAGLGDNALQTTLNFSQAKNSLVNTIKDSLSNNNFHVFVILRLYPYIQGQCLLKSRHY